MVALRVRARRLAPVYPGVYAVGHTALTRQGRWLAAVLACGPAAALSHGDAAALWGIARSRGSRIDVSTPRRSGRTPPWPIRLHRVGTLLPGEVTSEEGIHVTTVARTILDQAATVRGRQMEDMIAQADGLGLFDLVALETTMAAHPKANGISALAALLDRLRGHGPADVRSPGEIALLQLCDDFGIAAPATNVQIHGFTVDAHWPGTCLIVEVDGYRFHRMPTVFESDRDRDQILALAGYAVARFTKRQLEHRRSQSATRLRGLIARFGSDRVP